MLEIITRSVRRCSQLDHTVMNIFSLYVCLSVCPSVRLPACLFLCLLLSLSVCRSLSHGLRLSFCFCLSLSLSVSVCLSVSVSLSAYLVLKSLFTCNRVAAVAAVASLSLPLSPSPPSKLFKENEPGKPVSEHLRCSHTPDW